MMSIDGLIALIVEPIDGGVGGQNQLLFEA